MNIGFRLNNTYSSNQVGPKLDKLVNAGFIVSFLQGSSINGNIGDKGFYIQNFDKFGNATSNLTEVNNVESENKLDAVVKVLSNGNIVASWCVDRKDGSGYGVYAKIFNADLTTYIDEFRVNTYTSSNQRHPVITVFGNGNFVIVWQSLGQDSKAVSSGVYAQMYKSDGSKLGNEFRVNTYTTENQEKPAVATLSDGGFVVVWQSYGQDESGNGVYAQKFNNQGDKVGTEFRVNTYTKNNQEYPAVASLSNGDILIAWHSYAQDGKNYDIYAQRYDVNCQKIGGEYKVNLDTSGNKKFPIISTIRDDQYIVTCQNTDASGSSSVFIKKYATNDIYNGEEYKVNNPNIIKNDQFSIIGSGNNVALIWGGLDKVTYKWSIYGEVIEQFNQTMTLQVADSSEITTAPTTTQAPITQSGSPTTALQTYVPTTQTPQQQIQATQSPIQLTANIPITTAPVIATTSAPLLSPTVAPSVQQFNVSQTYSAAYVYANSSIPVIGTNSSEQFFIDSSVKYMVLYGGGGNDTYVVVQSNNSYVLIADFANNDTINFTNFTAITAYADLNITRGSTHIHLPQNQTVVIENKYPEELSASNFIFYQNHSSNTSNTSIGNQAGAGNSTNTKDSAVHGSSGETQDSNWWSIFFIGFGSAVGTAIITGGIGYCIYRYKFKATVDKAIKEIGTENDPFDESFTGNEQNEPITTPEVVNMDHASIVDSAAQSVSELDFTAVASIDVAGTTNSNEPV